MKSVTHLNLWVWIQHLLQCHGDTTRTPLRGRQEKGRGHQAAGKELTGRVSQEIGLGPQLMSWFLLWTGTKWHYNSISQWKARGHLLSTEKSVLYIPKAAWPRKLELKESWKEFNRGKKTVRLHVWRLTTGIFVVSWATELEMSEKRSSGATQLVTGWGGNVGVMPARRTLNATAEKCFQQTQGKL